MGHAFPLYSEIRDEPQASRRLDQSNLNPLHKLPGLCSKQTAPNGTIHVIEVIEDHATWPIGSDRLANE